ncbi:amidase [Desulfovibrio sp. OttesenSCG-928-M14]|nr:amidase [Desulfovibrio sp. OttesenSCG-928-M14]
MDTRINRRDFLRLGAATAVEAMLLSSAMPNAAFAIPADAEDVAYLSAIEQIKRFKEGTLSPIDVLEAQIKRILEYNGPLNLANKEPENYKTFNGKVNAITYEHFDEARKAAKEAEKRYKAGNARALEGVTIAIKDENDVKDWRVTMGSVLLQDAPLCEENTAIIDMLLSEGAIMHIQTTVPELYLHIQTWSRLWGVTRNPWNLHYAVGGSSGGSGAALAAGFTTLATGSDMGGSIRIPASLCGVYGFKPPFGRVPTSEISYETLGPLARTFDDMVLMQNVITGPHPTVHAALRPKLVYPKNYDSLKGVKIALDYFDGWIKEGVDQSIRQSLDEAAEILRSQGAIVEEVKLGWTCDQILPIYINGLLSTGMGDMLVNAQQFDSSQLTSYAAQFVKTMADKGPAELARADDLATAMHRQLQEMIFTKGCQALIMPTLLTPYLHAEIDPTTDTAPVNGKPVKVMHLALTIIWNLLSRYPVVDVPVGLASNNVPMGIQVVGNTFDDLAAFRVAGGYAQTGIHLYRDALFPDYRKKA